MALRNYGIIYKAERMVDKPINLEAIRKADARLKQLLEDHPDLGEFNPERQEALEAWLEDHLQEQEAHGEEEAR